MQATPTIQSSLRYQIDLPASDGKMAKVILEINADRTDLTAKLTLEGDTGEKKVSSIQGHIERAAMVRAIVGGKAFQVILKPSTKTPDAYRIIFLDVGAGPAAQIESPPNQAAVVPAAQTVSPEDVATDLYPVQGLDLFSLRDGRDLTLAKKKGRFDQEVQDILKVMIDRFKALTDARSEFVIEMAAVGEEADVQSQKDIVQKLIKQINEAVILSVVDLEALAQIFRSIQRMQYEQAIATAAATSSNPLDEMRKNPLYHFTGQDFLNLMEILVKKLNAITHARSLADSSKLHIAQVEAFVVILELMEMAEVTEVERTTYHTPFYDALDRFSFHENLKIAFLVEYGKQVFRRVPNDETNFHSFLRRAVSFTQGALKVYEMWEKKQLGPITEAIASFKTAFTFQEFESDWFGKLFMLRHLFLEKNVGLVVSFRSLITHALASDQGKKFAKDWHLHNPLFLKGIVEIMRQVLQHYATENPEAGKAAVLLLQSICGDNFEDREGHFTVKMDVFTKLKRLSAAAKDVVATGKSSKLGGHYSQQLRDEIIMMLRECAASHSSLAIRDVAERSFKQLKAIDPDQFAAQKPVFMPTMRADEYPNQLFEEAARKVVPWRIGLRDIKQALLNDPQLKYDRHFYMEVKAGQSIASLKDINLVIEDFIKSQDKVLLVSAPAGYGKSISMKMCCAALWDHYTKGQCIPLFISLPGCNDVKRMLDEMLEANGLTQQVNDLKKMRIVLFLDAFDELKSKPALRDLNGVFSWPNLQIVITARDDYLKPDEKKLLWPDPNKSDGFSNVMIGEFQETRIKDYLEKYLEVSKKERMPLKWLESSKWISYFNAHKNIKDLTSTLLFMRILADVLPGIIDGLGMRPEAIREQDVLDACFCRIVERENDKYTRTTKGEAEPISKEAYLDYHIKLAKAMQAYGWIKHPELRYTQENVSQTLFSLDDSDAKKSLRDVTQGAIAESLSDIFDVGGKNARQLRRCGLISKVGDKYGFRHDCFYSYFITVNDLPGRRDQVLERLVDDKYGFGELFHKPPVYY